jgi:opacity protein-like surface antigen
MHKLLLAAALAALLPASAMAQSTDASGAWKLTLDIAGMTIPLNCTFAVMDKSLGGTCDGGDGKPVAITGGVDGSNLNWAYDTTYMGMPMHVVYKGAVKPDSTISGTVDVPGASGTFSGTK